MHCHACGSQVPDDVKFCTICGAPFTDEPETTEEPKKPAEEPMVQVITASSETEHFEEELTGEDIPTDDPFFESTKEEEVADAEEFEAPRPAQPDDSDSALDPGSPDFDPRKFAGLDLEAFHPMTPSAEDMEEEALIAEEKAQEKRLAEKRSRRGVIALVISLVVILLAAAAGLLFWLTAPVKELLVQDDFARFMRLDTDDTITEFVIDARETSRLHRQDTIWCSVTVEDGSVHTERDYAMNYRLTAEGWLLTAVDELNTEAWVLKPMAGASAEEIAIALVGQQIAVDDTYTYTLTPEDAASATINGQTTDLEAGTDLVEATVSVVDELVGWTADVELEMAFDGSWQPASMSHSDVMMEFKPGMEFTLTEEDFLAALAANPIPFAQPEDDVATTVVSDGEAVEAAASAAQMIKIVKDQISDLIVGETAFRMEDNTQTVTMEFLLDKQVAKLRVQAAIGYVFEDGWRVDTITYAPTVEEIILDGEWKGTYTESEGRTPSVTLTIAENEDGTDNNVFAFGPSEANPYFYTGKYYVSDEADLETLAVSLKATDWVLYYNPGGVALVGLEGGYLMLDEAKITDGKTFTITLQRETAAETTEEEAPAEELVARTVEISAPFADVTAAPEKDTTPEDLAAPEETEPEDTAAPEDTTVPEDTVVDEPTEENTPPVTPNPNAPAYDPLLGPNDTPIL